MKAKKKRNEDRGLFPNGILLVRNPPRVFGDRFGLFTSEFDLIEVLTCWKNERPDLPWHKYPKPKKATVEDCGEWLADIGKPAAEKLLRDSRITIGQKVLLQYEYRNAIKSRYMAT